MVMKPTNNPMAMEEGVPAAVPTSVSLDLPQSIETLITMPTVPVTQGALGEIPTGTTQGGNPNVAAMDFRNQPMSGQDQPMMMQEGGMIPSAQMPQGPMNSSMMEGQINQTLSANPEAVARIRAAIEAGIQSGELDANELNMIIQLAKTVQQNPAMYPQIRQMAIQRGILPAQEIPEQYDEGLITAIIMAAKAMEADVQIETADAPMAPVPQTPAQPPAQMAVGGLVVGPSHAKGGVLGRVRGSDQPDFEVEGGEYVIPKNVVARKGTEFFDKMIGKDTKTT